MKETAEPRELALQSLYEAELRQTDPAVAELPSKAVRLVDCVHRHRAELDSAISQVARGWKISEDGQPVGTRPASRPSKTDREAP